MKIAAALLLLVGLAGCAEFNKPILPGDEWAERGTRDLSLPRY